VFLMHSARDRRAGAPALALQPRPAEAVKIAAERLDHPFIRAMRIDGEGRYRPDEMLPAAAYPGRRARIIP